MSATYIFRLDDISWDMNYENFSRIRDLFFKYDIHPIIGVIPNNEDKKLKNQVGQHHLSQEEFWREICDLQTNHGWAVALHGYNHVYITGDSGMFDINPRAEFAGLTLSAQAEKICMGKAIFEQHGLTIDAFMAPAHSLDWNTVEALKQNDIFVITDGCCAYPYEKNGVWFIPQVWPWPRERAIGIDTACFHINSWKPQVFIDLEKFIKENVDKCGKFQDVVTAAAAGKYRNRNFVNFISHYKYKAEKFTRALASRIKRKILQN